jgi:hypothetical protein
MINLWNITFLYADYIYSISTKPGTAGSNAMISDTYTLTNLANLHLKTSLLTAK